MARRLVWQIRQSGAVTNRRAHAKVIMREHVGRPREKNIEPGASLRRQGENTISRRRVAHDGLVADVIQVATIVGDGTNRHRLIAVNNFGR